MTNIKIEMKNLTAIVIGAGYERRLFQNGETLIGTRTIDWWTRSLDNYTYLTECIPLTAGGRLISPEELDENLAIKMGFYEPEIKWNKHGALPNNIVEPAPIVDLFQSYNEAKPIPPDLYRDAIATTRKQLADEIIALCCATGHKYDIDSKLCVGLQHCAKPLDISAWMEDQSYCGCFSETGIMDMSYVCDDKHKILIVTYDGESG